jgi:hypothetical protein
LSCLLTFDYIIKPKAVEHLSPRRIYKLSLSSREIEYGSGRQRTCYTTHLIFLIFFCKMYFCIFDLNTGALAEGPRDLAGLKFILTPVFALNHGIISSANIIASLLAAFLRIWLASKVESYLIGRIYVI